MKKLAILTLVIDNYGTKLQSYALCKVIESFNLVEPEVCNLQETWQGGTVRISKIGHLLNVLKTYELKSFKKILDFIRWRYQYMIIMGDERLKSIVKRKKELFVEFDSKIPYTKTEYSHDDVRAGKLSDFDIVLTGSDQVWNGPRVGCLDVFMCDFLHQKRSALSYAASFAMDSIPKNMFDEYVKYIQNMKTLLVRETSGVEMCHLLGRDDAKCTLDPTLLLEGKDYDGLDKLPNGMHGIKDYILVYSLTASMKIFEETSKLAKRYNCKMVMLKGEPHPPLPSSFNNSIDLIEVGPAEFLGLVKNAKCVVTSSYHALLFSLIFHTNFYVYMDNASSSNSRLLSTLSMFGLEKQLYYETSSLPKTLPSIDYNAVDSILKVKRNESIELLRKSIEDKLNDLK